MKCIYTALILGALPVGVFGTDVLKSEGFTTCLDSSSIVVSNLEIEYDRARGVVVFDVAGKSSKEQNVKAFLSVSAYGKQVYNNSFNPCDAVTKVSQLCPGRRCAEIRITQANMSTSSCRRLQSQGHPRNTSHLCQPNTLNSLHHTRS